MVNLLTVAWAGEKITITESTNRLDLPKETRPVPGSDFMGGKIGAGESSQGPVIPVPGQPSLIRNPKIDELIDRNKNWIYGSPNSVDRDKAIKEIFGVREYDLDGFSKRPKSMMERHFETQVGAENRPGSKGNGTAKPGPGGDGLKGTGEFDATGRYRGTDKPQDRGIIPELNPAYLFNPSMAPDPLAHIGGNIGRNSILPAGLGDASFGKQAAPGAVQNEPGQRDLKGFWEAHKSPLGRVGDPINDPMDATRSIMNPIAASARKPSVPAPGSTRSPTASSTLPALFPPAVASHPDFFTASRSLGPGVPGYTPPALAPVSAPVFQPKPAMLEIPRPKF